MLRAVLEKCRETAFNLKDVAEPAVAEGKVKVLRRADADITKRKEREQRKLKRSVVFIIMCGCVDWKCYLATFSLG
jgi:hypothetical protein